MTISFQNPSNTIITQLNTVIEVKLKQLHSSYPLINKVDVYLNTQINYKGIHKACEIRIQTSKSEFVVNCFESSFEKAIQSTFKVLRFQLQKSLNYSLT